MSRRRRCGQYPPAEGYEPYCPVCARRCDIPADLEPDEAWEAAIEAEDEKADRIQLLHVAYRRRHR